MARHRIYAGAFIIITDGVRGMSFPISGGAPVVPCCGYRAILQHRISYMPLIVSKLDHWDPAFEPLIEESRVLSGVPSHEARRFRDWVDWMADRMRHDEIRVMAGWNDGVPTGLAGYHRHGDIVRVHYLYATQMGEASVVPAFLGAAEPLWQPMRRIVIEGGPQTYLDEVLGADAFQDAGYHRFERARFERPVRGEPPPVHQAGVSRLPSHDVPALIALQEEGYTGSPDVMLIDDPEVMVHELLGDPWFEPLLSFAVWDGPKLVAGLYTLRKGQVAWIASLCVHPSTRGRGLARLLMTHAMASYLEAGFDRVGLTVTLDNRPAVRLYDHMGFVPSRHRALLYVREPGMEI